MTINIQLPIGYKPVIKHGDHDQSSHGSWATGQSGDAQVSSKTMKTIIERMSEIKTPGVTIDIRTGKTPKTGFICSKKGFEKVVKLDDFDNNKRKVIEDYIDKNIESLSEKGAFFGGWVVKSEEKVYLDVSHKFESRQDAVSAMFDNEQDAIYDVKNDSYIYKKDEKNDRANKAIYGGSTNTHKGYDQGTKRRFYRKNLESDRRQSLNEDSEHICLGRYDLSLKKHGDHDQTTHGSWAVGRYPKDSVPKARNGAKDYAYKKGIKQDDSIDYNKVVANRERASRIADIYESLPKVDIDAIDEYESLASEVEEQFDFMTKELGIKVEFVHNDPYKSSKEMFDDASKGVLKVLSTQTTGAHPLFSNNQNDKFRAVHDYFGHAATGRGFGQDGEEAAWVHHSQMFTEKARAALTTETRGQNSFYNSKGKQFADQKVALLPEEFWKVPVSFTKRIKVIYFDYGLKPVLKHGEHDQSEHGNWARGYTNDEIALIETMKEVGPTIRDLDSVIESGIQNTVTDEQLKLIVENDQDLYRDAISGIDQLVEYRLNNLQEEFPNHEYTEQEKATIYEDIQNEMIDTYVESQNEVLTELATGMDSGEFEGNPQDLIESFNQVYGVSHTGNNLDGEEKTISSQIRDATSNNRGEGSIIIDGTIDNDEGEQIGFIQREIFKENGVWNVEHAALIIEEDDYKGTGFGKEIIKQSEAWYVARGFGYIEVSTAMDGARHWARAGYDFNPEYLRENARTLIDSANRRLGEGTPARVEFDNLMGRYLEGYVPSSEPIYSEVKSMKDENFPLPAHFANIGYTEGATEWPGKSLMASIGMKYVKVLTPEGQKLLDGPIDHDGDGLIYDGTSREKPAPSGGKK